VLGLHWVKLLEQPEVARLAKNVGLLKEQVVVYKGMFGLVKSLDWLMGYIPIMRAHFHEGSPLSTYKRFWTRGTLSLLLVLASRPPSRCSRTAR
jgi:hypothetical protein